MEDSQHTEGTAETDVSAGELAALTSALTSLFRVFGGVAVIAVSTAIIILTSTAAYWIRIFLLSASSSAPYAVFMDSSVSIMVTFGLTARFLVKLYQALSVRPGQICDTLVQGAGLVLLVYPIMMVRWSKGYYGYITVSPGVETPLWFVYSIIGILFLLEPRLSRSNRMARWSPRALPALVFSLSLLIVALTFDKIWAIAMTGTLYSAFLVVSPIVVIVSTIMNARLPQKREISTTVPS